MEPIVQVSLDLMSVEDAMPVAEVAVRAGVDWLEAGTPLILGEGLRAVKALRAAIKGREVVETDGRHAYFIYPDGMGSSKLTIGVIEKSLGTRGTARNWNTVLKLGDLAQ